MNDQQAYALLRTSVPCQFSGDCQRVASEWVKRTALVDGKHEDVYTFLCEDHVPDMEEPEPEGDVYEHEGWGSVASTGRMVKVTFHPQAWQRDYAVPVDAEGLTTFFVPEEDAKNERGEWRMMDSDESDELARHRNAPKWIREWSGPFYVEVDVPEE